MSYHNNLDKLFYGETKTVKILKFENQLYKMVKIKGSKAQ
jgi:hypothetical protein